MRGVPIGSLQEPTSESFFPFWTAGYSKKMKITWFTNCFVAALFVLILLGVMGCHQSNSSRPEPLGISTTVQPIVATNVHFTDITHQAGIHFKQWGGGWGKKVFLEEVGSGCAFLDYDNDGWLDILLLNGAPISGGPKRPDAVHAYPALYHNNHDGTFTDVTQQMGLKKQMYAIGVAVGDYDNDGWDDIYISGYGESHLFHNEAGKGFKDVTERAHVNDKQFGASCCWLDYDNDGFLDLYVCNYVKWDPQHDIRCGTPQKPSYCSPELYEGVTNCLYHNNRNGTFTEVAEQMGVAGKGSKSLGVTLLDYDDDGWMDIFVANDGKPNLLFHNDQGKGFHNVALEYGVAFPDTGTPKSGMGTDAADFNNTGRPGLIVGNFSSEGLTLSRSESNGIFTDVSASAGVFNASLNCLTFGTFFFDYDLDGYKDIFAANGHIQDDINEHYPAVTYRERPLVFQNRHNGNFDEVGVQLGLTEKLVARSACYGDFDNDGDLDILVSTLNGEPHLYRNDGGNRNHWLKVQTIGHRSNRDGIGARVQVEASGMHQVDWVRSGSSYCAQSDRRLCFGLGSATRAERITVRFPSGKVISLVKVLADRLLIVDEEQGLISSSLTK